jgi:hypothetical protein
MARDQPFKESATVYGGRQKCFNFVRPEAITEGFKMRVLWSVMLYPGAVFF